ncbi:MAG: ferredoxin oxidoreductase [Myxococcales bacterium]|nr:ferredoxin oxidoreductase [Myxococcales bacterium]
MINFPERVNAFAFKIATPNGSGSASANGLIMQAIFRMGIPVSGKNVFPSNIQGLPTWYEIRVNKDGHTARTPDFDLFVALNPATYKKDVAEVRSGGWLLYDSTWPLAAELMREDVTILGIPLAHMVNEAFAGGRERILMKNIAYAGALAALLDLDMEIIAELIKATYGRKAALLASNEKALALGFDYAKKHFSCPLPIRLAKMDKTAGHILIDGNTAAALGCVYAGATVGAWYPITPATSLMEGFKSFCQQFRENPDGTKRYAILQAEDELSAIGMVIGASWMGARSFTPTSGPGISLMSEFIGLAYYAEIPAVIFDVQRTGPSTGMPTRTQQGDLMLCAYASHGDTKHLVIFPANPEECFHLAVQAFDAADRFQTPVFVLSDLDIGMNDWMVKELTWDDAYRPDRGKVFTAAELDKMQAFHRYLDVDGDGIAARTLPGTSAKGAYFTRGSGHNKLGGYTEDGGEYVEVVDRIARKINSAAEALPQPVIIGKGHKLGIITVGSNDGACREALEDLGRQGIGVDYLRVRAFPFAKSVRDFIDAHDSVFIVESNRDGQLRTMIQIETGIPVEKLKSIRYYGGFPMSSHHIVSGVTAHLKPQVVAREAQS